MAKAKPDIEARMTEYQEGQIEFAILSLVKDPLLSLIPTLAKNVKSLVAVTSYLETQTDSTENLQSCEDRCCVTGPDPGCGITAEAIEQAKVLSKVESVIQNQAYTEALNLQKELCDSQAILRISTKDEIEAKRLEEQKANGRRYDYGPLALKLAQILARKPIAENGKDNTKKKRQKR